MDAVTELTEVGQDNGREEYDPYQHRKVDKPTSTLGTLMHVIKGAMGIGILAMPHAFRNGGLLFGIFGTLLLGLLYAHCVHMLVNTSYKVCTRDRVPSMTFAETIERACAGGSKNLLCMGRVLKCIVEYYLIIPQGPTIYLVFIGTTLRDVVNFLTELQWDVRIYILLASVPALFITQIQEIKYLVPFSTVASFLIFLNVLLSFYYIFEQPISLEDRQLFPSISTLTSFLGTTFFAFNTTSLIFPLENKMKHPKHYLGCPGVINASNICLAVLYGVFGFVGYARYGDAIKGSVTLNFPKEDPLAIAIQLISAVAILFSIAIHFYVPVDIAWGKLEPRVPKRWSTATQSILRLVFLAVAITVACIIPEMTTFIGFAGSVLDPLLALWVPIIIDTTFRWPHSFGWMQLHLVKNILIGMFGLYLMITGSIVSVRSLVDLYS